MLAPHNINVIATECDIRLQSIMTLAEVHCATFFIDHYKRARHNR